MFRQLDFFHSDDSFLDALCKVMNKTFYVRISIPPILEALGLLFIYIIMSFRKSYFCFASHQWIRSLLYTENRYCIDY